MTNNSARELLEQSGLTAHKITETLENHDTEEAGQEIKEGYREINYDLLSEEDENTVNEACRAMVRHSNALGKYQKGVEGAQDEGHLALTAAKANIGWHNLCFVQQKVSDSDEYDPGSALDVQTQLQDTKEGVNDPLVHGTMETIREIGDPRNYLDESSAQSFEKHFINALTSYQSQDYL